MPVESRSGFGRNVFCLYQLYIAGGRPNAMEHNNMSNRTIIIDRLLKLVDKKADDVQALILWADEEGQIVHANTLACESLGYPLEDLSTMQLSDIDPAIPAESWPEYWLDINEGKLDFGSGKLLTARGELVSVEFVRMCVIADDSVLVCTIAHDIMSGERAGGETRDMEERLKETSQLFEMVFNAIPDILGIQDIRHGIIRYNAAGYDFLNTSYEEVQGKKCFHLIGRTAPCTECATSEVYRTKKPARLEKYVEELNAWLDVRAYPILDENGRLLRVIEHLRDITDRKRTEEALRESQTHLLLAQDGAGVGSWEWHIPTGKIYWSVSQEKLFGLAPGTFAGNYESLFAYIHPDDRSRLKADIEKAVTDEQADDELYMEHRIVHPDGQPHWIEARGRVIRNRDGQPVRMIGMAMDITQRRMAELELDKTRGLLHAAVEQSPAGILIADAPDVRIRLANPAALGIRGDSPVPLTDIPVELHPKHWQTFWPDGTPVKPDELPLSKAILYGTVSENVEVIIRQPDGSERWVLANAAPVRDPNGKIVAGVVVFPDITEQKQTEIALRKALAEVERLKNQLQAENVYLKEEISRQLTYEEIIGESQGLREVLNKTEQVAPTDATVLLLGETGVGKELIARAIHERSKRSDRPLIKVNCASIPKELFESEFFGHVKGAFTGAHKDRIGRFQLADGGTLFLDEIGEIPFELQSKLLRVLQEGEFERIGEDCTQKVDVRIIASTNRHLEEEIIKHNFRQDLYFRLSVFPIEIPPLSERLDDIELLAEYFLRRTCRRVGLPECRLQPHHITALKSYSWPGNIRELENVIERSLIASKGSDLKIILPATPTTSPDKAETHPAAPRSSTDHILKASEFRQIEIDNILAALEKTNWKIYGPDGAAKMLDMKPSTLTSRIKALGITRNTSSEA